MKAIGMNLAGIAYWSTEEPFVDRFKTSTWYAVTDSGWEGLPADTPLDANGYPTVIPVGVNQFEAEVEMDPQDSGHSDVYVVTWRGNAAVDVPFDQVISRSAHRIVFRHTDGDLSTAIQVSAIDPKHPLSAIHVVRQDQMDLFRAGELFNPAFVAKEGEWDTLRYMDWDATNGSLVTDWSQRTLTTSASWAGGVPIEAEVALANETRTNMWINIPAEATDDYVTRTLGYVRDNLAAGLKVDVEYSNEVWNFSFQQAQYALQQGDLLWGHGGHVADGWVRFYGYRSAQIATIAHQVFGDEAASRLVDVLSTQTAWEGLEQSILAGAGKAHDGSVRSLFGTYAVTTYFGGELDGIGSDAATVQDRATVLGWARGGAAGLDAAFQELAHGGLLNGSGSLDSLKPILACQAGVAHNHGLSLVAYEGGVSLNAYAYDQSVQGEIVAFFDKLVADPRMGQLYTQMVSDFSAVGGKELNAYNDVGGGSIWGEWGALDSIYDRGSPRWDALKAAEGGDAARTEAVPHPAFGNLEMHAAIA